MIKNIVFDLGNVLIRFDPELFLSRYPVSEKEKELLRNRVFRTVEWAMMDRGVLDEADAKKHILSELPDRLQSIACDLIDRWEEPLVPVDGMMDLLRELKRISINYTFSQMQGSGIIHTGRMLKPVS